MRNSSNNWMVDGGDHFTGTVSIMNADGEIQQVYTAKRVSDCDSPLPEPNPAPPVPAGHE